MEREIEIDSERENSYLRERERLLDLLENIDHNVGVSRHVEI